MAEMTTIARVKTTLERELKLDVDPGFALPDLGGRPLPPRTLTSTYYDTPDRRLFRVGDHAPPPGREPRPASGS